MTADRYGVSFGGDENVLKLGSSDRCAKTITHVNWVTCTVRTIVIFFLIKRSIQYSHKQDISRREISPLLILRSLISRILKLKIRMDVRAPN